MSKKESDSQKHSPRNETEPDTYPEELVERDQWMNWFFGDGNRKIPAAYYTETENQHSGKIRENWTNFENARWWVENRDLKGVTFVLTDDDPFLVIDGDDVRNAETEEIHPSMGRAIERAESYADVSVSGTGIHIVLHEALPDGIDKIDMPLPENEEFPEASVEVYDHGQHIVTTGDHLLSTPAEVRCNPEIVDHVVGQYEESTETDETDESSPVKAREHDEGNKPDEWPACYYAGLRARERPPEGANKWQIDSLTGQLGIWAGFSVNEITDHFERFCPTGKWDEEITRKSLNSLKGKIEGYDHPPGIPKLYHAGILSVPACDCEIHGETNGTVNPRGPSIHALEPDDRQEVSDSAVLAVTEALEDLRVASAKEIGEWTGYGDHAYKILRNDDWRDQFERVEVGRISYWHTAGVGREPITVERLSELPLSLAEFAEVVAGREHVDTDGKGELLDTIHEVGPSTVKEASEQTDYSVRQARRTLSGLADDGFVEKRARYGSTMEYAANPQLVEMG